MELAPTFRFMYFLSLLALLGLSNCKKEAIESEYLRSSAKTGGSNASLNNVINPADSLLFYYSFDTFLGNWFEKSVFYPYSTYISPWAKSGKSVKIELRKGENIRAELATDARTMPQEGWFGFSVFFPYDYATDPSPESIVQFQAKPDFTLGENWRSPPVMLGVLNDRLILEVRTSAKQINNQGDFTFERIDLGLLTKNKWTDYVFHIKWASDNTGVLELWKNNSIIHSRVGKPNSYNDLLPPYFKIGIYKWDWAGISKSITTRRIIYVDEVRIGKANAGYASVVPK